MEPSTYRDIELTYADAVFGHQEPEFMVCSNAVAVCMFYKLGPDIPALLLPPNGPGFSVQ